MEKEKHSLYYSPDYCRQEYSFDTTRKARWIADSLDRNPIDQIRLIAPPPLSLADLRLTHSDAYISAIATGEPEALAAAAGVGWCENTLTAGLSVCGGVVAACRDAVACGGVAGSLSSGLHHAKRDRGDGFCTFNGLAIAARDAVARGLSRVLILDLDAHCGGGTASLIDGEVRITQLDISVDSFDCYRSTAQANCVLVGDAGEYLSTLDRELDRVGREWDLVIYNAGMDVHERDCGPAGIDSTLIACREVTVFEYFPQVPIAYVMAGGYSRGPGGIADLVSLHRLTLRAAASVPRGLSHPRRGV